MANPLPPKSEWVRADFNGLFGDILCLTHKPSGARQSGAEILFEAGMMVTAFDLDGDENGNPDDLVASGIVELPSAELQRHGSQWVLSIDENVVRHESE